MSDHVPTPPGSDQAPASDALERALLERLASNFDLAFDEAIAARLVRYLVDVHRLTREINLIGPGSLEEGVDRHLVDCLAVALHERDVGSLERANVLDFGTGGGFPGVVLACWRPQWEIFLCDARRKKLAAIRSLLDPPEKERIGFVHGRLGALLSESRDYREAFDLVTSRAVSRLDAVIEETAAALAPGGCILVWKSWRLEDSERSAGERAADRRGLEVLEELVYEAAFTGRLCRYRRPR